MKMGGNSMIYLSEQLRSFRLSFGFTQEEVAQSLSVSPQTVSKWERGETYPDIELLPALANLFETSVDALLGMDRIRSFQHMSRVMTQAHDLYKEKKYLESSRVLQEQLKLFPNDVALMTEIAYCLCHVPGQLQRAIDLCEGALRGPGPVKAQHTARAVLVFLYERQGNHEKAQSIAGLLPHERESREVIRAILDQRPDETAIDQYIDYLVLGEKI